jgi:hypothetical protein
MSRINIDGKSHEFEDGDLWCVEVGRYTRGAYKSRYTVETPQQGTFYYRCINLGNGYKKRLVLERANGQRIIIAKEAT